MLRDLSIKITTELNKTAADSEPKVTYGHLGTHFDVMNKEFPLELVRRNAIVFDVSDIRHREIGQEDINLSFVNKGMFVAFHTGFIEEEPYGTKAYFTEHPQFSYQLVNALLQKEISIIGVDCAGVRRGGEHTTVDQYCADKNVFIIENLCNLASVLNGKKTNTFIANTYPLNYTGVSGLPCRVVAEISDY